MKNRVGGILANNPSYMRWNTAICLPRSTDLKMNDIARMTFKLAQPLMVDSYSKNRATGAFIVIDESTNNTVGAGMII